MKDRHGNTNATQNSNAIWECMSQMQKNMADLMETIHEMRRENNKKKQQISNDISIDNKIQTLQNMQGMVDKSLKTMKNMQPFFTHPNLDALNSNLSLGIGNNNNNSMQINNQNVNKEQTLKIDPIFKPTNHSNNKKNNVILNDE